MFKSIASLALGAALTFSLTLPGGAQQAGYTVSSPSAVIEVEASMAITLTLDTAFSELSMASPEIADLATLSETQIYLLGKTIGETTITVLRDGTPLGVTDYKIVVYRDITPLKTFLAGPAPRVELVRDSIVVTAKGCVDGPRAQAAADRVIGELENWGYVTLSDIISC